MNAVTTPTLFIETPGERYAYRRLGKAGGLPLLCLQHFTGTLDNWDPAIIDVLAQTREVILFDNAGVGGSSGAVPETVAAMAEHACAFLDALRVGMCDVLGFSLGGMVAQQMALDRPSLFRRMILVATAPRGGDDIMHLEKPSLAQHLRNPDLEGYAVLQRLFFAPSETSQAAGAAFLKRLEKRTQDLDPRSGSDVAAKQIAAFREWEQSRGERFSDLRRIEQPSLVVNGVFDEMISVENSYRLAEHLPNAVLIIYPDAGHGALFQFHVAFARQADAFLSSNERFAPY